MVKAIVGANWGDEGKGKITDLFLQGLRRAHAGVALKAVLTPTNSAWTPRALYAELQREHEAMAAGKTAHPQN